MQHGMCPAASARHPPRMFRSAIMRPCGSAAVSPATSSLARATILALLLPLPLPSAAAMELVPPGWLTVMRWGPGNEASASGDARLRLRAACNSTVGEHKLVKLGGEERG